MLKQFLFLWSIFIACNTFAGLTAEDVLGEYWKDPLFGEAAESYTVSVEVLNGKIWPEKISVSIDETIRFVFENKSDKTHLFAFSNDIESLLKVPAFNTFIKDELFHSKQEAKSDPRSHTHSSSSVDDAQAIVKTLGQRPTILIKPNDTKEILVRFNLSELVELRCVIDDHKLESLKGIIKVLENE